jgi:hypothetical protein
VAGALNDSLRVVSGHHRVRVMRSSCLHTFLDIYQAQVVTLYRTTIHIEKNRVAESSERTVTRDPVCGIERRHIARVWTPAQTRSELCQSMYLKKRFDFGSLFLADWPETIAERYRGLHIVQSLARKMLPRASHGLTHHYTHHLWSLARLLRGRLFRERLQIPLEERLDHVDGGNAKKCRPSRGRRQRQSEANEIMHGVTDDGLIEVANLNFDFPLRVRYRAKIACVAVTTDPDGRTFRQSPNFRFLQPVIEFDRVAVHVGVRRAGHLHIASGRQYVLPARMAWDFRFQRLAHGFTTIPESRDIRARRPCRDTSDELS